MVKIWPENKRFCDWDLNVGVRKAVFFVGVDCVHEHIHCEWPCCKNTDFKTYHEVCLIYSPAEPRLLSSDLYCFNCRACEYDAPIAANSNGNEQGGLPFECCWFAYVFAPQMRLLKVTPFPLPR